MALLITRLYDNLTVCDTSTGDAVEIKGDPKLHLSGHPEKGAARRTERWHRDGDTMELYRSYEIDSETDVDASPGHLLENAADLTLRRSFPAWYRNPSDTKAPYGVIVAVEGTSVVFTPNGWVHVESFNSIGSDQFYQVQTLEHARLQAEALSYHPVTEETAMIKEPSLLDGKMFLPQL